MSHLVWVEGLWLHCLRHRCYCPRGMGNQVWGNCTIHLILFPRGMHMEQGTHRYPCLHRLLLRFLFHFQNPNLMPSLPIRSQRHFQFLNQFQYLYRLRHYRRQFQFQYLSLSQIQQQKIHHCLQLQKLIQYRILYQYLFPRDFVIDPRNNFPWHC